MRATYFRHVLPLVVGFPHRRVLCVIRLPTGIWRACPFPGLLRGSVADMWLGFLKALGNQLLTSPRPTYLVHYLLRFPLRRLLSTVRFQHRSVSGFPLLCPNSGIPSLRPPVRRSLWGLPSSRTPPLPACHGLRTPADLPPLALAVGRVLPSGALKPSASAIAIAKLYQHFRVRDHPCGLQDTLSTLRPSCSPRVPSRLRHGRKTRYGWMAHPYPTGSFTLQETPSFSWRDNATRQARRTSGARHERNLFAAVCTIHALTGSHHCRTSRASSEYALVRRRTG